MREEELQYFSSFKILEIKLLIEPKLISVCEVCDKECFMKYKLSVSKCFFEFEI
jgi:hypothetical protein